MAEDDFKVGDLVTPNYKGVQWGWPKGYEAEVVAIVHPGSLMRIRFLTEEATIPFDGTTITNDRDYGVVGDQFKRIRVTKKSIDQAIKSIMSRP